MVGSIVLPALRWSEGLQAWVGPWQSGAVAPVLLDVALWNFGEQGRQFSDEGVGLSHFELCVGTEPMVCDLEPKMVVERDVETLQVAIHMREFHISVWAHDHTGKQTAASCRGMLDATLASPSSAFEFLRKWMREKSRMPFEATLHHGWFVATSLAIVAQGATRVEWLGLLMCMSGMCSLANTGRVRWKRVISSVFGSC